MLFQKDAKVRFILFLSFTYTFYSLYIFYLMEKEYSLAPAHVYIIK